ncbi:MAG: hypothetical protein OEY69_00035 [Candidatus Krumholzibacteria bacterium]|nr:hypothetical protein [Candidatus Krumholzibacteria bacterium]
MEALSEGCAVSPGASPVAQVASVLGIVVTAFAAASVALLMVSLYLGLLSRIVVEGVTLGYRLLGFN